MDTPTSQHDHSAEAAVRWNSNLAGRVRRQKRLRLACAGLLAGAGMATVFFKAAAIWSAPCFIAAFIAYLLYLDSRDQLREVTARRWKSLTPRFNGAAAASHKGVAGKPSQPGLHDSERKG